MPDIIFFDGEAHVKTSYGMRPLKGRFATVGKRRHCLILSATKDSGGVSISFPGLAPNANKVEFFPFDSDKWQLTYQQSS